MSYNSLMQKDVLKKLEEECKENSIGVIFEENEDEMMLHMGIENFGIEGEDVELEIRFEDQSEGTTGMQYVRALIYLDSDYNGLNADQLGMAMSILNSTIPCGTFALSKDMNAYVYKLVTPVSDKLSFEELYDQVNIVASNAVKVADTYYDALKAIALGHASGDAILEVV